MANTYLGNFRSTQAGATPAEAALPSGIPVARRVKTLNSMERAIVSCARALDVARQHFQDAQTEPEPAIRQTISAAQTDVLRAITCLRPIERLIDQHPEALRNTEQRLKQCKISMRLIAHVSAILIKNTATTHRERTLTSLANACQKVSAAIDRELGEPIRRARHDIAQIDRPGDALTS